MDATLNGLLHSRKFWLAVFGLITNIIFHFIPDFPTDIWQSVDALVVVLIMAIAIEDAGANIAGDR